MAEILTATRTQVANNVAQKAHPTAFNRPRVMFIDPPPTWSAANGDTAPTALVLPAGSRLMPEVTISSAAGNAGSTVSVGLRNAATKEVLDATAIVNAASLATAQVQQVMTGTKSNNGQFYTTPVDAEVFLTFGGATPLANQAYAISFEFCSP